MKRILSLILACVLVFGCVLTLASCENFVNALRDLAEGKKTPIDDPDEAKEALIDAGYVVNLVDDEDAIEMLLSDIDGVDAYLQAYKGTEDAVIIIYFEDKDALKDAEDDIDELFEEFAESAEEEGIEVKSDKSDTMAWIGTEDAIEAAAGRAKKSDDDDKKDEGDLTIPNSDFEAAHEALLDAGYEIDIISDPEMLGEQAEGLIACITAWNDSYTDIIIVYYFGTKSACNAAYDELETYLDQAKVMYEEMGMEIFIDKSDKMIWMGTEDAIKDTH